MPVRVHFCVQNATRPEGFLDLPRATDIWSTFNLSHSRSQKVKEAPELVRTIAKFQTSARCTCLAFFSPLPNAFQNFLHPREAWTKALPMVYRTWAELQKKGSMIFQKTVWMLPKKKVKKVYCSRVFCCSRVFFRTGILSLSFPFASAVFLSPKC